MKYTHSFHIGEARLCAHKPHEQPGSAEDMQSLHEKIDALQETVRNQQDVIKRQGEVLRRIQNDPSMPRPNQGRITVPVLKGVPGYEEPRAQATIASVYNGKRMRTHLQKYPARYKREVIPLRPVPTKKPSPLRIRYNRIDGKYYEMWDEVAQQYVKGPTIETAEQVREMGRRNREAREERFARRDAQRRADNKLLEAWNDNRNALYWQTLDRRMATAEATGFDPFEMVGGSIRAQRDSYDADMAAFHKVRLERASQAPKPPAREREMTFEQSQTFKELFRSRSIPDHPGRDMQFQHDAAGNLLVWRRVKDGWKGSSIEPSGRFKDLGTKETLPTPQELSTDSPAPRVKEAVASVVETSPPKTIALPTESLGSLVLANLELRNGMPRILWIRSKNGRTMYAELRMVNGVPSILVDIDGPHEYKDTLAQEGLHLFVQRDRDNQYHLVIEATNSGEWDIIALHGPFGSKDSEELHLVAGTPQEERQSVPQANAEVNQSEQVSPPMPAPVIEKAKQVDEKLQILARVAMLKQGLKSVMLSVSPSVSTNGKIIEIKLQKSHNPGFKEMLQNLKGVENVYERGNQYHIIVKPEFWEENTTESLAAVVQRQMPELFPAGWTEIAQMLRQGLAGADVERVDPQPFNNDATIVNFILKNPKPGLVLHLQQIDGVKKVTEHGSAYSMQVEKGFWEKDHEEEFTDAVLFATRP